jgi:hypothetical protein
VTVCLLCWEGWLPWHFAGLTASMAEEVAIDLYYQGLVFASGYRGPPSQWPLPFSESSSKSMSFPIAGPSVTFVLASDITLGGSGGL